MNLPDILTQLDSTRDDLLICWGRISAKYKITHEDLAEFEGLAREWGLLNAFKQHAIADGKIPASLLSIFTEITDRKKTRFNASEPDSALLTLEAPKDDFAGGRGGVKSPDSDSLPPAIAVAAGDVF